MKWIAIVPCSKNKLERPAQARRMYSASTLFRLHMAFCASHKYDTWVLSAKYGFLKPNDVIEPYDLRMGQQGSVQSRDLFDQLAARQFRPDYLRQVFVLLGGADYRKVARAALESYGVSPGMIVEPFKGLEIGQLQQALKAATEVKQ